MIPQLALITILFIATSGYAQTSQQFFVELGKTGLIFNFGYDRHLSGKPVGYRILAGSNFGKYLTVSTAAAGGYYLIRSNPGFIELGLDFHYLFADEVSDDQRGFRLAYPDYSTRSIVPMLNFGVRRYSAKGVFRLGISAGFIRKNFAPGAYISAARRFE